AVDFKPWSLELTLHDLAIARSVAGPAQPSPQNSPQTSPQLSIKRVYIDAEIESLLRLAPVADAIEVDEPVASLTHLGEGRYDIDDVLDRLKPPPDQPASTPLQFALYNLVLKGGALDFNDLTVQKTQQLRDLDLAVPFLSNLKSQREVKISPRLAFKLNGSVFDSTAEATPFAQTRKTDATLKLSGLDLKPYLGYLPASLPFRLQDALLDADLKVDFAQTPGTVVKIAGTVTATKVRLLQAAPGAQDPNASKPTAAAGPELLAFDRLQVVMDDVRPLEQFVKLASVELTGPRLRVVRDRAGRLNLLPPAAADASKKIAAGAGNTRAAGQKGLENTAPTAPTAPTAQPARPWKVAIARMAVRGGKLDWLDETLPSPAQIALVGLNVDAQALTLPFAATAPVQFKGSLGLDPASLARAASPTTAAPEPTRGSKRKPAAKTAKVAKATQAAAEPNATPKQADHAGQLNFSGSATDKAANVTADLAGWPLGLASRYVGQFLLPALGGQLDAQLGVNWQAAVGDKPQTLQVTAPQLTLRDVQLAQGKTSLVSVKRLQVEGADIDVPGQSFKASRLTLSEPKALVERDASKRWMFERWRVERSAPPAAARPDAAGSAPPAPPWAVAIHDVLVEGGALSFSDKAAGKPVAFEVSALNAQLQGLVLDDRPGAAAAGRAARPMPLTASLRLASGRFEPGKLDFKGSLGLAPVQAQGQLTMSRLPVQAFEPYFAEAVNIELLRADASFKGRVMYRQTPAGPVAQLAGDAALEDMKANTLAPSEDLLAWKTLNLRGLSVALDPAKATRVDVKETALTDFFARVIVTPEGRINLQDLLKKPGAGTATAAPTAPNAPEDATKTVAARADNSRAAAPKDAKDATGREPIVNVGPISLINGTVRFSDRFIKPNYSADLTELTGRLSAFSSEAPAAAPPSASPGSPPSPQVTQVTMADLELRGRAEGTASLEITGKLNPLAKPLALDITGKVRDLELPPLSPYAIKYAGYGITRGKMSVDVNYVVLPNGQLTAKNKLVLNQLSFGDKVDGAPASLPVKLAVALLADRNGVIDLDLPISGSLNDPQFSLGPIIVKVILNVITKAITAPFSLLANALGGGSGGGDSLSSVSFAPGSAQLTAEARVGLDKVARALTDRPALTLTVVGTSSLDAEREGFKRQRLDDMLRAEKRRATVKEGGAASAKVSVSPAEYPALLKEVYQRADIPKPRNLIGLARDLPQGEMEKLLLASIPVTDEDIRALAVQRGVAVKTYLASRDLPPDRLFLGAAKTLPPDPSWTPRAELNLASP
ncbi:DUF748 domain-containing protein, partial [Polaromonas sp.]|uniref:DUF748 domain-containing protein n=1 Tax=Polaromonas sp. TaxID=1869339 RepID=UPI002C42418B